MKFVVLWRYLLRRYYNTFSMLCVNLEVLNVQIWHCHENNSTISMFFDVLIC